MPFFGHQPRSAVALPNRARLVQPDPHPAAPDVRCDDAGFRPINERGPIAREPSPSLAYSRSAFAQAIERFSRIINVPDVGQLAVATAVANITTPAVSGAQQVEFQQDGWIVGLRLEAKNDGNPITRTCLAVRIEAQGNQKAITTDGTQSQFIPFSLLCPTLSAGVSSSPLVHRVKTNDKLRVTYANFSTALSPFPSAGFLFISDDDLEAIGWPKDCAPPAVGSDLPAYTRALLVPGQVDPFVGLAPGQTGPGTTTAGAGITEIQQDGLLVGFRADVLNMATGVTNFATYAVGRSSMAAQIELFGALSAKTSDGQGLAFTQIPILCGGVEQFAPFVKRVQIYDKLRTTFRNTALSTNFTPAGCWFLRADSDVRSLNLAGG